MRPVEFRPDVHPVVVKNDLGTSLLDDDALMGELAIAFVEVDMPNVRNRPAVRGRQIPEVLREVLKVCRGGSEGVQVDAYP